MGTAAKVGPVGERVAENVKRLRGREHVSVRELSARLRKAGRPILPSGITKLEQGERRVDVDDLVALADALDVGPLRLMEDPSSKPVDLEGLDTDGTVSEAFRAIARVVDTGVSIDEFFDAVKVTERLRVVFGPVRIVGTGDVSGSGEVKRPRKKRAKKEQR